MLVCIGAGLPFGVYLATEHIKSIPNALIESARIDRASFLAIFTRIVVPMSMPVAVTLSILNSTSIWNEFVLMNILVSKTELKSLPLGIYKFSGSLSADYGGQFAALPIGMVQMLLCYVISRKQIARGVAAGAVKG